MHVGADRIHCSGGSDSRRWSRSRLAAADRAALEGMTGLVEGIPGEGMPLTKTCGNRVTPPRRHVARSAAAAGVSSTPIAQVVAECSSPLVAGATAVAALAFTFTLAAPAGLASTGDARWFAESAIEDDMVGRLRPPPGGVERCVERGEESQSSLSRSAACRRTERSTLAEMATATPSSSTEGCRPPPECECECRPPPVPRGTPRSWALRSSRGPRSSMSPSMPVKKPPSPSCSEAPNSEHGASVSRRGNPDAPGCHGLLIPPSALLATEGERAQDCSGTG